MKNDRWLKKYIKEGREIRLSAREKRVMLRKVMGPMSVPSPYYFLGTLVAQYHKRAIAVAMAVLIVLTSGGTSLAATGSLPGDTLYTIKVNVNEEIQNLVALTPNAKAKVAVTRTAKRLEEAETLSKQGRLTDEKKTILETNIIKHTEVIKQNIATLTSENATATVKEVIQNLESSIEMSETALTDRASSSRAINASSTNTATIEEEIKKAAEDDENINSLLNAVKEVKEQLDVIDKDTDTEKSEEETTATSSTISASTTSAVKMR